MLEVFFNLNLPYLMDNNRKPIENQDFELNQENHPNDYQILLERFKSIKKAIVSLEKILNK